MRQLPDVNVWLALAFQSHVHHRRAKAWLDRIDTEGIFFCRLTQQGFLRIATNPKAFGAEAVSLKKAWSLYDHFAADDRIAFAGEPSGLESVWRELTEAGRFSSGGWSDAYLAAFAIASESQMVSFDKGFTRFDGLQANVLS